MVADTTIRFDITLDLDGIKTAVASASQAVNSKLAAAFERSEEKCQKSCDQAAREFGKISQAAADAGRETSERLAGAFEGAKRSTQESSSQAAQEFGKIPQAASETSQRIEAILNDQTKSMKSKAASISWIYRKEGMDSAEAMRQAWSEIDRVSNEGAQKSKETWDKIGKNGQDGSKKVKDAIKGIGTQADQTANQIDGKLLSALKKIALAIGTAFTIKKLFDFGKSCIELGSDLTEVQNVVDVTFPRMSKQVDEFAKNAAMQFGLSETMAKRFTGTFGAMAKAFGFPEKAAYDMSTTLTGLSGDVASFYNISQDEAYTKLKSVFTGETESLKDLGIVMTQTALDSYALANGFGKTTSNMSEMEKVALRYQFVQSQLTDAAGDFSRTSDSWANQVRILQLQFESLKATIGQGLINVLSPVIKVINTIIGKILTLANAFKAFTEMITGKKGSGGGVSAAASGMDTLAKSAGNAGQAAGGAGKSAKKAAQDLKGVSTGIDELNIINPSDKSGSGGSGGSGGGGYDADDFDMGTLPDNEDIVSDKLKKIMDLLNQLKNSFTAGFWDAFGDTAVFDSIQNSIASIKTSLQEIFSDPAVQAAALEFANTLAYSLGQVAGSVASIGATIADNLLGGISLSLERNKDRIKQYLIDMFDIGGEIVTLIGNYFAAVGDVFTVFRSDSAKQVTSDFIQIFSDAFMGVTELGAAFTRDLLDLLTAPFTNNTETLKTTLEGLLKVVETVMGAIAGTFRSFVDGVLDLYNGHISPLLQSIRDGFSNIVSAVLEAFNAHILPVLEDAGEQFSFFCSEHLQPLIEAVMDCSGKAIDAITELWEGILAPFVAWFFANVAPIISTALQVAVNAFFFFLSAVSDVVSDILTALGGLIDFLTGVFTGDWEKAWEGIKTILSSIWNIMKTLVNTVFRAIWSIISTILSGISQAWNNVWTGIKNFASSLWSSIKNLASSIFGAIRDKLSEIWDSVRRTIEEKWNAIKKWFDDIWKKIKDVFKPGEMVSVGRDIMNKLWSGMTAIWEDIQHWLSGVADAIGSTFRGIVNKAKDLFESAKEDAEDDDDDDDGGSKKSSKKSKSKGKAKGHATGGFPTAGEMFVAREDGKPELVGSWGGRAAVANNVQIIEGISRAVKSGMSSCMAPLTSSIQTLAYRSTPPLASVGTVPIQQYAGDSTGVQEAIERLISADGPADDQQLDTMIDLLRRIIELIENMNLTVNIDIREIRKKLKDLEKRSGVVFDA